METWQEVLRKNSISSLESLAARFGPEHFPDRIGGHDSGDAEPDREPEQVRVAVAGRPELPERRA